MPFVAAPLTPPQVLSAPAPRTPALGEPLRGLDLWRGARVGMNAGEVRRLFPAASAPPAPTMLTGGEVDRLQLAGAFLGGVTATAHFFFKDGGLVSVELFLPDLPVGSSRRNLAEVGRIAADLTARYGAPYDCGEKGGADVTAYGCKWLRSPLSVRLWYMDVAGQAPLSYVAFRQADDPGYDL